jgi:ATP-binding cassette subfamily B protein
LSTLRKANRLVVLDRGQVVEVGDHETLMEREGAYFRLYQAQVRQADESDEVARHKVWRDEDSDG